MHEVQFFNADDHVWIQAIRLEFIGGFDSGNRPIASFLPRTVASLARDCADEAVTTPPTSPRHPSIPNNSTTGRRRHSKALICDIELRKCSRLINGITRLASHTTTEDYRTRLHSRCLAPSRASTWPQYDSDAVESQIIGYTNSLILLRAHPYSCRWRRLRSCTMSRLPPHWRRPS